VLVGQCGVGFEPVREHARTVLSAHDERPRDH
jgi:hypothetical protein